MMELNVQNVQTEERTEVGDGRKNMLTVSGNVLVEEVTDAAVSTVAANNSSSSMSESYKASSNGNSKKSLNEPTDNKNEKEKSLEMEIEEINDNSDNFSTGDIDLDGTVGVSSSSTVKKEELEKAKKRLSKWSLRLFDPNRPKGVVETPTVIPLKDDFLIAFGNREKEYDESIGRTIDVDRENLDIIEINSEDEDEEAAEVDLAVISQHKGGSCKIKVFNLAYTTSQKILEDECEKYGSTIDVNLVMDMEKALRNSTMPMSVGRAYVTFLDAESASKCVEALNEKLFDGRIIRVRLVFTKNPNKITTIPNTSKFRYWEKDISTKCFRCRRVGHKGTHCTFEEIPRPCFLCGSSEHQFRVCPISTICFNCGVPGHVSRNCILPKGIPRRIVCTYCYQSGHHRMACRSTCPTHLFSHAKCITCEEFGHFVCKNKDSDWISKRSGGVYCFNCGLDGHTGYDCKRPKVESCTKDCETSLKEIERAWSLTDKDDTSDRYQSSKRGRSIDTNYEQSKRAKSAPPPVLQRGKHNSSRNGEPGPTRTDNNYSNTSRKRGYHDRTNDNRTNDNRTQSSRSNDNSNRDRNHSPPSRSRVMSATYDPRSESVSYSNFSTSSSSRRYNNSRGYR